MSSSAAALPTAAPTPVAPAPHQQRAGVVGGSRASRYGLRAVALGYLGMLVALPVALLFARAFGEGLGAAWASLTTPAALHALKLTVYMVLIAVPLNTVFGVLCALAVVRHEWRGKRLLDAFLSLPLGVSPVVVGLALMIVYNRRDGWFGPWLADQGIQVVFALPSMVLATIFVSLPFVAREVIPVLREIGTDQEQAAQVLGASAWQTFWQITLPAIRAGVAYGVVLTTARALGEYGAVAIVSGKLAGRTETLTLHVEERFLAFDLTAAYAASLVLAGLALATLLLLHVIKPKEGV